MTTNHAVHALRFVPIALLLVPGACRAPQATNEHSASATAGAQAPADVVEREAPQHAVPTAPGATPTPSAAPAQAQAREESAPKPQVALEPFEFLVPGTTQKLAMRPVPGGTIQVDDPAQPGARVEVEVAPLWFGATEITWDMYDAFVFAMDRGEGESDPPDAWTRPSKPYILMDRGFGHAGYPAISVSYKGANEFCKWLSFKTGRRFRLPTEAEWEHAATVGLPRELSVEVLGEHAWLAGNSEVEMRLSTHPVQKKKADASGLHDMLGNAAEWTRGADDKGVARGGSFKDPAESTSPRTRRPDDRSLNKTDPQVPKSVWWLADGGFIGLRVVCEPDSSAAAR